MVLLVRSWSVTNNNGEPAPLWSAANHHFFLFFVPGVRCISPVFLSPAWAHMSYGDFWEGFWSYRTVTSFSQQRPSSLPITIDGLYRCVKYVCQRPTCVYAWRHQFHHISMMFHAFPATSIMIEGFQVTLNCFIVDVQGSTMDINRMHTNHTHPVVPLRWRRVSTRFWIVWPPVLPWWYPETVGMGSLAPFELDGIGRNIDP